MIPRSIEIMPFMMIIVMAIGMFILTVGIVEAEFSLIYVGSFMTIAFFLVTLVSRRVRTSMRQAAKHRRKDKC